MARRTKLTDKQRAFVAEYVQHWNATRAAKAVYDSDDYNTLGSIGTENLKKPLIQAAINEYRDAVSMTATEVLQRLTDQARGSIADFIKIDAQGVPVIDFAAAQAAGKLHLVKKVKVKTRTYTEGRGEDATPVTETDVDFELYDAQSALQLLGKGHGLFKESIEHTGKDGGPIETKDVGLTDEERTARITALLDRARARRDRPPDHGPAGDVS